MRRFNTAGPSRPGEHYMLPPERRLPGVRRLIDEKGYFVVHAPRQSGKTTALLTLARALTAEGRYAAVLVSMETGAPFSDDPERMEPAVLAGWRRAAEAWLPHELRPPPWPDAPAGSRIEGGLAEWCRACPRPLVLFLDEADALRDDGLVSVLRQLRAGHPARPEAFPWSLALIGMRDVRDYRVASADEGRLGTQSPFNVAVESLSLRNFTRDEVGELYAQHTADTGQAFDTTAVDHAFEVTRGQPWLVNALGRQLVEVVVKDSSRGVTPADVDAARDILIQRQDTHLDSLAERLREPRVRAIIEPMLAGGVLGTVPRDDISFVEDLGLVRQSTEGGLVIANPIYQEVIARILSGTPRASLPRIPSTWLTPAGDLDTRRLLDAFLAFWCQHGEALLASAPYHEVAPHLVMLAFLDRVANGGGRVDREYAIGTGRMDICVRIGRTALPIEIKVWAPGRKDPLAAGLTQVDRYMAGLGASSGWLVIFDRRPGLEPVEDRLTTEATLTTSGREVVIIRA